MIPDEYMIKDGEMYVKCPAKPASTIYIGENPGLSIGVNKKFNWFQKKMIKWCFGFEVKENS